MYIAYDLKQLSMNFMKARCMPTWLKWSSLDEFVFAFNLIALTILAASAVTESSSLESKPPLLEIMDCPRPCDSFRLIAANLPTPAVNGEITTSYFEWYIIKFA